MTKLVRILILTPDLDDPGGVANYYNVAELHKRRAVEYFFVNRKVHESSWKTGVRLTTNYLRFCYKLATTRYRTVHLNPSLNPRSFYRDGIFALIARLAGTPVLITFHGWDHRFADQIKSRKVVRAFFRLTFGRCTNFIVLGQVFRRHLLGLGLRDAKIWVDTTIADAQLESTDAIARKIQATKDELVVLFIGRIVAKKGVHTAIRAVEHYQTSKSDQDLPVRLWIAGEGKDLAQVCDYVRTAGLDYVEVLHDVRNARKIQVLERAHVLLFPTTYPEGLATVVLEAMVHGMPVLTRPEGAIGEVVKDGINGFITPSTDPDVFGDYLRRLAQDPALYRRMALANLKEGAHFSKDAVAERVIKIYDQIAR